ncbi:MAG: DUF6089 family protein [Paludibacteraceae bacterium]
MRKHRDIRYFGAVVRYGVLGLLLWGAVGVVQADNRAYLCELGLQAGCGYYVGDAAPHIFHHPREAYGAHFRYKFTPRWALQIKGLAHRITGNAYSDRGVRLDKMWETPMINIDAMAEFNFFRLGMRTYDSRIKPVTPYIFLGAGASLYGDKYNSIAFYIPLGFGLKWKFSERVGLNIAWQYNIYIADNLEGMPELGNTYNLNGSNILNNDLTSQLTLGIVFEFAKEKKVCRMCNY